MRTTLDIEDALLIRAKSLAARQHISLSKFVEQALVLRTGAEAIPDNRKPCVLPVYVGKGGLQADAFKALGRGELLDLLDNHHEDKVGK